MTTSTRHVIAISIAAFTLSVLPLPAQSRHERKEQQLADAAAPKNVPGGVTFQSPTPIEKTYDLILNDLKRQGHSVDRADRDAGQIVTAMEIEGNHSQTGTRISVTLIKDNETQTSIRVIVTKQKRKKLLQTEPWSDPKADAKDSQQTAGAIKAALKS
jgi:hypothetical protein